MEQNDAIRALIGAFAHSEPNRTDIPVECRSLADMMTGMEMMRSMKTSTSSNAGTRLLGDASMASTDHC